MKFSEKYKHIFNTDDGVYRLLFFIVAIIFSVSMIFIALNTGVNADDIFHFDYSERLVKFYSTFGADQSALLIEKGQVHLYGGLFDSITGGLNHLFGFGSDDAGYIQVRHVFNAFLGFVSMIFVALILKHFGGWKAAVLGLVFMFFSPRFLGHSMMNPKDIPFAAGYIISIYFMIKILEQMPKPKWTWVIGLGIGLGLALGTRVGAMLLFAYMGLFSILSLVLKKGIKNIFKDKKLLISYFKYLGISSIIGIAIGLFFWPYAMMDPFKNIPAALNEFTKLSFKINMLFGGENISSIHTPWYYSFVWIGKTIPLFTLFGFLGSFVMIKPLKKKYEKKTLAIFILYFSALFPVLYIIAKSAALYDGWRHLIFVYPSMVVIAALFWLILEEYLLQKNKWLVGIMYILLLSTIIESGYYIIKNPTYTYAYFNVLGGGTSGAFGHYETDYWGLSSQEAIQQLEKEGLISPDMKDTITIATTFKFNVENYTNKRYGDRLKIIYTRFDGRYRKRWDYGIFPSRFIPAKHLRNGTWPNSRNISTVKVNGVPFASIETGKYPYIFEGEEQITKSNYQEAIKYYQAELEKYPLNEVALRETVMAYSELGAFDLAKKYVAKAFNVAPNDYKSTMYMGIIEIKEGNLPMAKKIFQELKKIDSENGLGYFCYAFALKQEGNSQDAYDELIKAIELLPEHRNSYLLAIEILEEKGDTYNAKKIRDLMEFNINNPSSLY